MIKLCTVDKYIECKAFVINQIILLKYLRRLNYNSYYLMLITDMCQIKIYYVISRSMYHAQNDYSILN